MSSYVIKSNIKPIISDIQPNKIDHNGTQYFYSPGTTILHNENGPALIFTSGNKHYYLNGKRGRNDGLPTIEGQGLHKEYHANGKLHRDGDLPAKIDFDGTKYYYRHRILYRDNDLPSIEYPDVAKIWFKDGKKCKYFYPALEWKEGDSKPSMYILDRLNSVKVIDNKKTEMVTKIIFTSTL